jgi:hypothetical protein
MITTGVLVSLCINNGHNWGDDFALYIEQAKSILNSSEFSLYQLNKYAMQNSIYTLGPYLYPYGFPLLLCPVYYFFGLNFTIMKGFCGLFLIMSIPLIYRLFRPYFPNAYFCFFIIPFIAFHKEFITSSDNVQSDLPFLFFSLLTIVLMKKSNGIANQFILGICIYFSYFIRDIGIMLIPTLFAYQIQVLFINKNKVSNRLYFAIPYFVFAFLFAVLFIFLPKGGQNLYSMISSNLSLTLIKTNFQYYRQLVSDYFFTVKLSFLPLCIIIIAGMFSTWKQHLHLIVYTVLICFILTIWPFHQGTRFIFPIMPFIIYFLLKGAWYICHQALIEYKYLMVVMFILSAITTFISVKQVINFSKKDTNQSYTPDLAKVYNYISTNISKNDIVGYYKPRAVRLFSNRNAIGIDPDHFDNSPAKYLLIERDEFKGIIMKYPKVFETQTFILVKKSLTNEIGIITGCLLK